ncbi:MAG: hypothetical protein VXY77_00295 [Pseudomonadota bacterium]|nr:hypothetical protein [Pseudomonadota bacterium]
MVKLFYDINWQHTTRQLFKQKQIQPSFKGGIALWVLGVVIDTVPTFLAGNRHLAYWWSIAFVTMGLLYRNRGRFLVINSGVLRAMLVPLLWSLLIVSNYGPLISPTISLILKLMVCVGINLTMYITHVESWLPRQKFRLDMNKKLEGLLILFQIGIFSLGAVSMSLSSLQTSVSAVLTAWGAYVYRKTMQPPVAMDLSQTSQSRHSCCQPKCEGSDRGWLTQSMATSLTLAMGMAWGYSSLRLIMATLGMKGMGCYFFCDAWKTMGAIICADTLRQKCGQNLNKPIQAVTETDRYLRDIILPGVFTLAQTTATAWFFITKNSMLSVDIYASVLIFACPCVIRLVDPLLLWVEGRNQAYQTPQGQSALTRYHRQQIGIVSIYYSLSLLMATGATYLWTGFLLRPWHAALAMVIGQLSLLLNTVVWVYPRPNMKVVSIQLVTAMAAVFKRDVHKRSAKPLNTSKHMSTISSKQCCMARIKS